MQASLNKLLSGEINYYLSVLVPYIVHTDELNKYIEGCTYNNVAYNNLCTP